MEGPKGRLSIFEVVAEVQALLPEHVEVVTTDEFVFMARAAGPTAAPAAASTAAARA